MYSQFPNIPNITHVETRLPDHIRTLEQPNFRTNEQMNRPEAHRRSWNWHHRGGIFHVLYHRITCFPVVVSLWLTALNEHKHTPQRVCGWRGPTRRASLLNAHRRFRNWHQPSACFHGRVQKTWGQKKPPPKWGPKRVEGANFQGKADWGVCWAEYRLNSPHA